jgi:hypothetical protein
VDAFCPVNWLEKRNIKDNRKVVGRRGLQFVVVKSHFIELVNPRLLRQDLRLEREVSNGETLVQQQLSSINQLVGAIRMVSLDGTCWRVYLGRTQVTTPSSDDTMDERRVLCGRRCSSRS